MKLRQLQCLCGVVDAGFNLSRAAAALHTTQPAVSKQLRQLEHELGLDLLHRHGGRVLGLTESGERTTTWARRALLCVDNIRGIAQDTRGDTGGRIVVATSQTQAKYALLPAIPGFSRRHPKVRIVVNQSGSDQAIELVREGNATFGLISVMKGGDREVVALPFRSSRLVLITAPDHPLGKSKKISIETLAGQPFVLISPSQLATHVLERFRGAGLDIDVVVQAQNSDMAKDFVAAGLGIALIPSFAYEPRADRRVRGRDVGDMFDPVVTSLLLRRNSHLPRYACDLLEAIEPTLDRRRLESIIFGG